MVHVWPPAAQVAGAHCHSLSLIRGEQCIPSYVRQLLNVVPSVFRSLSRQLVAYSNIEDLSRMSLVT